MWIIWADCPGRVKISSLEFTLSGCFEANWLISIFLCPVMIDMSTQFLLLFICYKSEIVQDYNPCIL